MLKNEVRIIGGKWRGRKIKFCDVSGLRPSPDRVRETLFNWLSPYILNARCLDLFAGSGVLGFEALSRGASEVVFVDKNETVIQQLKKNREMFKCDSIEIHHGTAQKYLEQANKPFDIVFLDPPFYQGLIPVICKLLNNKKLLKSQSLVYLEKEKNNLMTDKEIPLDLPNDWKIIKQKKAGRVLYYLIEID